MLRSRTELVPVPVTVKNTHGELVPDLTKDDFRVFEDGKEQNIALFSTEAFPLSVVVVLDNDLTVKVRDQVQKSLDSIAGGLSQTDEALATAEVHRAGFPARAEDLIVSAGVDEDRGAARQRDFRITGIGGDGTVAAHETASRTGDYPVVR